MAAVARVLVILAAGVCVPMAAGREQVVATPMSKVITMLNDMMAKGKAEKQDELVAFTTYKTFCDSTRKEKEAATAKGSARIEKLTADIAKAEEDIAVTSEKIGSLNSDIAAWSSERSTSTAQRDKEAADFAKEFQDYSNAIDEVQRVVSSIKAGSDVSLVQLDAALRRLPPSVQLQDHTRHLGTFLQRTTDQELMEAVAPEPETYESHSFGALKIVEEMGEKFEDKRNEVEKEDMKKKFAFQSLDQDLANSISEGKAETEELSARLKQIGEEKAQATMDVERLKNELAEDSKFLSDLNAECDQKAVDFEKRQGCRRSEMDAIQKALEILSGGAVTASTGRLPSLTQEGSSALAQLRSSIVNGDQQRVAAFLDQRAQITQSRLLALVADRVQSDPMKKVTKMIEDMINKLMAEATEEAEHKGFCDTEMGTNKQTRDRKTEEMTELTAQSEKLTADITKLGTDVTELSDQISELDAMVAKATTERSEEKAKNTITISEARMAHDAVRKAMTVLQDFYSSAAEATALAQFHSGVPGAPETFDKPYTGMGGGGVMSMLEVVESDFARLDGETTASEAEAAGSYNKFMTDSKKDRAVKTADMDSKVALKGELESELASTKKDLTTTKEELDGALAYYEKLKPTCVDAVVTYEDRVAKRKEEIESLQEALKILSD